MNADAAFNGESVSATVLSLVVFSGTGGLLATVDCIDRIQLVSDLLLLGTGPGIASCLVLTSPARAAGGQVAVIVTAVAAGVTLLLDTTAL